MEKSKRSKVVANILVGRADVEPDIASHVRGVAQGNASEQRAAGTSRRSTGIRAKHHDAIDPRMPKISPA